MSDAIEDLVARLRATLDEIDWLGRKPHPVLRKPATDDEIAALARKWGRDLPPSFEAFLRLANGMEGADQYDWAIAGATEPRKGESFEDVRAGHLYAFKQQDAGHPVIKDLHASTIAGSDFDYQVVYWDPKTLADPEPRLRRVGLDAGYDEYPLYANFAEFLEFVVEGYEELLDFQNEPMDDGRGAGGGGGYSKQDEALLMEIAALLDRKAPEPAAAPAKLSPEMQLAADLCELALEKLLERELIELVEGGNVEESLEDYMLRKLLKSKSPEDTIEAWIDALSKAREVEELYGTDEELKAAMLEAFEEISQRKS